MCLFAEGLYNVLHYVIILGKEEIHVKKEFSKLSSRMWIYICIARQKQQWNKKKPLKPHYRGQHKNQHWAECQGPSLKASDRGNQ